MSPAWWPARYAATVVSCQRAALREMPAKVQCVATRTRRPSTPVPTRQLHGSTDDTFFNKRDKPKQLTQGS